jgi:hypothetical protein
MFFFSIVSAFCGAMSSHWHLGPYVSGLAAGRKGLYSVFHMIEAVATENDEQDPL